MTAAVALGVRCALGGARAQRLRCASTVLASLVAAWLMLSVLAIARAENVTDPDLQRLLASVVTAITVSVLILVATASRLSASVRDRRLASLRLLGLSPRTTRLVAAVEVGTTSAIGVALGWGVFWLTRGVLTSVHVAGRDWGRGAFQPTLLGGMAVLIGVPLVSMLVSALPMRLGRPQELARARPSAARRPTLLRLLPLTAGVGLLTYALTWPHRTERGAGQTQLGFFVAGSVLAAVGVVLVVPVLVRLVADLSLRLPGQPALTITARRLQLQPAAASRVVAGLLLGLFAVAGARCVVSAFEQTPQYVAAEHALLTGPQLVLVHVRGDTDAALNTLSALPAVRGVVVDQQLSTSCLGKGSDGPCVTAFVGTCADVHVLDPTASGCRNDRTAWIDTGHGTPEGSASELTWIPASGRHPQPSRSLTLPPPTTTIRADQNPVEPLQAAVFLPISPPGVSALVPRAAGDLLVVAGSGAAVQDSVQNALDRMPGQATVLSSADPASYYLVAHLRALVWAVAGVIVGIGVLAFVLAAIDRAVSRRGEMVALQLVGTPRRTIRGAQWLEVLLPLAFGVPLATGLGLLAGSAYLAFGSELSASPWQQVSGLTGVVLLASVLVAGVSVIGCCPPIRADLIRRE